MNLDPAIDLLRIQFQPASLIVLNAILGILMFGVALDIKLDDFRRLAKDPKGPLLGLGGMAIVAAWWGGWHIIAGLSLATFWGRRPLNSIVAEKRQKRD